MMFGRICLAFTLAVVLAEPAHSAEGDVTDNFHSRLPYITETICRSLQLFGATPEAPKLRWIMTVPTDDCLKRLQEPLVGYRKARLDHYKSQSFMQTAVLDCVKRQSPFLTAGECWAAYRSDEINPLNERAHQFFFFYELTGLSCAEILRERGGGFPLSGVCIPFEIPVADDEAWKVLIAALYNGAPRQCLSARAAGGSNPLIEALAKLFETDISADQVRSRLNRAGFRRCGISAKPDIGVAQDCTIILNGYRFARRTGEPDDVRAMLLGDMLTISVHPQDGDAQRDICIGMVSSGL
jgi:hypothetical protein